jgi:hypothetical protein
MKVGCSVVGVVEFYALRILLSAQKTSISGAPGSPVPHSVRLLAFQAGEVLQHWVTSAGR